MTLQQRTLTRYRQLFPNETLKQTAFRTQIQITRVFRLFNGKRMKVEELEAFNQAIHSKLNQSQVHFQLQDLMEEASTLLNHQELAALSEYIRRKNQLKKLKSCQPQQLSFQEISA
jgi:septum formation inhibitor MinC